MVSKTFPSLGTLLCMTMGEKGLIISGADWMEYGLWQDLFSQGKFIHFCFRKVNLFILTVNDLTMHQWKIC